MRKIIEQIHKLVKTCEIDGWEDDEKFLRNVREQTEKFKIKYNLLDNYGLDIKTSNIFRDGSFKIEDRYAGIHVYTIRGDETSRILNSDKQPNNELLMEYSHSTGPYIFDEAYDRKLFDEYFDELKKYKYKYIDNMNHSLYFDLNEGFKLYKDYANICEKYQKISDANRKKRQVERYKKLINEIERSD